LKPMLSHWARAAWAIVCAIASEMFFCVTRPCAATVVESAVAKARPAKILDTGDICNSLKFPDPKDLPRALRLISGRRSSLFQFVACAEHPPDRDQADDKEQQGHADTDGMADIGNLEETPAESADQVDHRVEQRDGLPGRRQDAD